MTAPFTAPKRILVVRGGAIGDFVLTMPVLTALRGAHPGARLAVLGSRECGELAMAGGLADEVRPLEGREWAGFFVENGGRDASTRDWLRGFDWVISFLHDPDGIFQSNVREASDAQFVVGCHRPPDGAGESAASILLSALEPFGITNADAVPRLEIGITKRKNVLAVHPGSGSAAKNWPEKNWAAFFTEWLVQNDSNLLLIGGEAEAERVARLSAGLPHDRHRVLLCESLVEVARALNAARAFVGHDSGITHLAAAVGLPGVALWAATDATVWGPPSVAMKRLQQPVEPCAVLRAVTTFFN